MKPFNEKADSLDEKKAVSLPAALGPNRIPELDGLRGIAIFLVIICHYIGDTPHGISHSWRSIVATVLSQGAIGVDLFFILSGFLIGGILLRTKESPRYYKTFYLRRFHRIIPLYYGWIILFGVIWMVSSKWGGPGAADFRPATPFWTYFVFLHNYVLRSTVIQAFWRESASPSRKLSFW